MVGEYRSAAQKVPVKNVFFLGGVVMQRKAVCRGMGVALALVAGVWSVSAMAQTVVQAAPQNVVQLSASGSVEVTQDLLMLTLTATEEGSNAAAVQKRLQQVVDAALATVRPLVKSDAMEVRTQGFTVAPRTSSKDGKLTGWQGRAQLVLEGKDFDRITSQATKVQGMQVSQVAFGLSKEGRAKVEGEAQQQAISQFQAKAASLSKAFGFRSYSLREVSVNSNEIGMRPYMAQGAMFKSAMAADAGEAAPLAVEAGKTQVEVQVSGSVQLQ
jgi:predicted secreted protein